MAILNTITMKKKLENLAQSKRYVGLMKSAANTRLVTAKNDLLEEFDDNIVVKEIIESSKNPSITESEIVSKGNITSYIGLSPGQGQEQMTEVKSLLKNGIYTGDNVKIEINGNKVNYHFPVKVPPRTEIEDICKTEWTSNSWVNIIERGVSVTLKKFIFWAEGFRDRSRSGTGLQSKGKVNNVATLTPTPFITKLLNDFKEKFL